MIAAVVLVATFQGIVIGLVAIDMVQRFQDRKSVKEAEKAFLVSQQQLAELHNNSSQTMKDLADKLSALEMVVRAPTQPTPFKKF